MASDNRRAKVITDLKDLEYLFSITQKQTESLSFMMETFGVFAVSYTHLTLPTKRIV